MNLPILSIVSLGLTSVILAAEPFPVDQLWQSESFRKAYAGSYGIDSQIEPLINDDESFYLKEAADLLAQGDRTAAIQKIKDSSLVEKSPALLFSLGNFYYEEGEPKVSISYFEKALVLFPNFRDAHRNVAMVKIQDGDAESAEPHLRRAIELGSQEGLTFGLLAYCHIQKNRLQAALSAYQIAQVTMPDEIQWQLGEAYTLQSLDEVGKASSIYANLIKKHPTDVNLWISQANAYAQKEDHANAIAHLEIANRIGNLTPQNRVVLGQMFVRQSIPDLALENFKKAIKEKGVEVKAAIGSLNLLASNRYWNEVRELGHLCRELYEEELSAEDGNTLHSAFHRAMAMSELETGDANAAVKRVEKLLEVNPLDGDALLLLAKFREENDRAEEAIMLLEQAALIEEKRAAALLSHGRILVGQFRYTEALDFLDQSYDISPSGSLKTYIEAIREL